jgi:hypothetical protein
MNILLAASRFAHVHVPAHRARSFWRWWLCLGLLACLSSLRLAAQTTIYSENWESYTSYAATNLSDTAYAFPFAAQPSLVLFGNSPKGGVVGSGVQLVSWLAHGSGKSLLVRSGCEADVNLYNTKSGTRYQLDFWVYIHKHGPDGTAGSLNNFYIQIGGEGVDNNGDDWIAYRGARDATYGLVSYNGTTAAAWQTVKNFTEDTWQHHRLVVDSNARTLKIYIDDMNTAAYSGYLARSDVAVPTLLRYKSEGGTVNDGYYAIDDITLTVDNAISSLDTAFTDGFESYSVGVSTNIHGPWVTVACNGTGSTKTLAPWKAQVVDSSTITPHSGTKCLALKGAERGGVALAWGLPPKKDVKITWWANAPTATFAGLNDLKLNMALYNSVGGSTYNLPAPLTGCTAAQLAYGLTASSGSGSSLMGGASATTWTNTGFNFTPNTWEEYQLITDNAEGTYCIIKDPSSANPTYVVSNATFLAVGSSSGPTFMASWASPPCLDTNDLNSVAYIDDIKVESVNTPTYGPPAPQPSGPYTAAVLSNNPAAYYSCQEVPGSFILWDSSPTGGHHGRWGSDTAKQYPQLGQAGIGGNSVLFHTYTGSGGTPCATAGYYPDLNPIGPFAAELWVKALSVGSGFRTALGSFAAANGGWEFYQVPQGNGAFQWVWVQQNGNIWITSSTSTLNQWHHLAASFDGTYVYFYVDGQLQGRADSTASKPNPSVPVVIGANSAANGLPFDGNICQVALYNHALSASDFATHYQVGSTNIANPPNPPTVLIPPSSVSAYAGTPVSFQVIAAGYNPLSYQWYRNGTPIPGATSDIYQFVSDYNRDNGQPFTVTVTNKYGSAPSSAATLTLMTDLYVTNGYPASITRRVGSKAAFLASAGGAQPISYQWYKGSELLSGATDKTLWLNNVQLSDDGSTYYAHVNNPYGLAYDTAPATLNVVERTNVVPLTGYAAIVAAADPVAYWRLDQADTNSPVLDAIGSFDGGYMATNADAIFTFGLPTGIPLETNVAMGVTSKARVNVPYALELNPTGPFTAEAWVQPNAQTSSSQDWRCPFASMEGYANGWNFYLDPDDRWRVLLWNPSGSSHTLMDTNTAVIANRWYHLVLSYDGSLFSLYVNGALQDSAAYSGYARNTKNPTSFGWRSDAAWNPFSGTLDDIAFYNKALSAGQVLVHYQNGLRLTANNAGGKVVLSWPLGTLQQSSTPNGTYTDMSGVTSPYTNASPTGMKFYRVKANSL